MRIIIIGQGNVACNLLAAFNRNNVPVEMVSSYTGLDTIAQNADVYIYAVRDAALEAVINQVHTPQRALHIHTSGTVPITVFGPDKPHCGILYPFQTLSKAHIIEDFTTVPVFIEARGIDDISALYTLAVCLRCLINMRRNGEREGIEG